MLRLVPYQTSWPEQAARHLAFRDYLRRHPAVCGQYWQLKQQLAAAHHGHTLESRESYSLGKPGFVEGVLVKARAANYHLR